MARTYVRAITAPQNGLFYDSNPMGFRSDFPSAIRELSDFDVLSASRTPLGHPSYHARIPSFFPSEHARICNFRAALGFGQSERLSDLLSDPLGNFLSDRIRGGMRGARIS